MTGSESVPQITIAVIDSTGSYTYSFPSADADQIWPGITATTAADTLQASPAAKPQSSPCTDVSSFCGVFAPFSQATTTQELAEQVCCPFACAREYSPIFFKGLGLFLRTHLTGKFRTK